MKESISIMYAEREVELIPKIVTFVLPNGYPKFSEYFTLQVCNIDGILKCHLTPQTLRTCSEAEITEYPYKDHT